jgi:crotonobetainyl-CoA:carnitine CoA-transferase CaiB-like acyl-CoA transferase
VAIACRSDDDWAALAGVIGEPWAKDADLATVAERRAVQDALDADVAAWTSTQDRDAIVAAVRAQGVPAAPVKRPPERCDDDAENTAWGLWPTVQHAKHGEVRVDGQPVHLSATDWRIRRGGPVLGEHNERVLTEVLGLSSAEIGRLAAEGVI